MKKLKAGIIGTGSISRVHLENMVRLGDIAELVSGCDPNASNLDLRAEAYGFRKYPDYEKMLKSEKLDFVILAAPQMVRKAPIELCVSKGIPVFTEKPPAADLRTAKEILKTVKKSNVPVSVAFLFRYSPIVKKALELLSGRQILLLDIQYLCPMMYPENRTSTRSFYYSKELSGGFIIDQAIHLLDLSRHILNDEIERVFAFGANLMQKKTRKITTEESASISMRSAKGALVSYLHTWTHRKWDINLQIFAPDARLELDLRANTLKGVIDGVDVSFAPSHTHNCPYFEELNGFVKYISGAPGKILSDYGDSVRTMALADAVSRSIETEKPAKPD